MEEIKQIYSWVLKRDLETMKAYCDEKRVISAELRASQKKDWNKLVRGY